jgi:uncharacterized protein (DUF302 family)
MAKNPLIALDLPLKVIAWEDDQKKVWLAYNEAAYIPEFVPHFIHYKKTRLKYPKTLK